MENFATLDDIFSDPMFGSLVEGIKTVKLERMDPEVEKFIEILKWVEENGKLPQKSRVMAERKLYSRLEGIKNDTMRLERLRAYDKLGILGVE